MSSKDSTAHLFNRYIWLLDTIYRSKRITFEAINEKWLYSSLNKMEEDLPKRTFHTHINAIYEMFKLEIKCDIKNGYKYYLENFEHLKSGNVRSWLINTFAVNNLINESHHLKDRILFEKIPSGDEYLTPIIEAMRDNLKIEITYQSYWKTDASTFEVCPYCVKVFKQRWYVVGLSEYVNEIRIYALDRIKKLETTKTKFNIANDFDGEAYFANCFGIIHEGMPQTIKLKVLKINHKDLFFESLPLHHSQKKIEENGEFVVFQYFLRPSFDFRQELLSHGADVEVLEPQTLREEMKNSVEDMVKRLKG